MEQDTFFTASGSSPPQLERATYTVTEVAVLLGISRSACYAEAKRGTLPGIRKVGHRLLVLRSVFDTWLAGEAS